MLYSMSWFVFLERTKSGCLGMSVSHVYKFALITTSQTRPNSMAPPPPNDNERRQSRHLDGGRSAEPHTNGDDLRMDESERNQFNDRRSHHRDNRSSLVDGREVRRPEHRHSHSASHPQTPRAKSPPLPAPTAHTTLSGVVLPLITEVRHNI